MSTPEVMDIDDERDSCGADPSLEEYKARILADLDASLGLKPAPRPTNNHYNNSRGSTSQSESESEDTSQNREPLAPAVTEEEAVTFPQQQQQQQLQQISYNFNNPALALDYHRNFNKHSENFTKGCQWSPDGSCLLAASADKRLRIFNSPTPLAQGHYTVVSEEWQKVRDMYAIPAVDVKEREIIYDYCWYPFMRSDDPQSCCFAVSCRDQPVHLWDAWTGQLICSYRPFDHLDQMVAPISVGFSLDGSQLVCGFKKTLRVFQTSRPGRTFTTIPAKDQSGIISCMAFNPQLPYIFAAGSYNGTLGLYNMRHNNCFCVLDRCSGGVTQLKFSSCGTKLFTGTRRDTEILCWDIRNLGNILCSLKRKVTTNQRIQFDLDPHSKFLLSGSTDGQVLQWDLTQPGETVAGDDVPTLRPSSSFKAHQDCTNGISLNPHCPLLATSSGQRHFPDPATDGDTSDEESAPPSLLTRKNVVEENTVKLWWLGASAGDS